jgi:gentisate 1,2-dioxygenase
MSELNQASFAATASMEELMALLQQMKVGPGWAKKEPSLWPAPRKNFVPAHWSYELGRAALDAAGRFVSTEFAERRNLILANPVEGNDYATVRTIISAYQMVKAGEVALSHRHSPNALRLIVDTGPKAYTVVNGKKIPMLPGDVVLTPNWQWHGHANESDQDACWIDFLDVPTVQFYESMFFEKHEDWAERTDLVDEASPARFPYAESIRRLDAAEESQPGARIIELGPNPIPTMRLLVSRLEAGRKLAAPRTTANSVFAVIDGQGRSNVDGTVIEWRRGDVFAVPAWRSHEYQAAERSHLLRVTDEPMLQAFGWLRTEN